MLRFVHITNFYDNRRPKRWLVNRNSRTQIFVCSLMLQGISIPFSFCSGISDWNVYILIINLRLPIESPFLYIRCGRDCSHENLYSLLIRSLPGSPLFLLVLRNQDIRVTFGIFGANICAIRDGSKDLTCAFNGWRWKGFHLWRHVSCQGHCGGNLIWHVSICNLSVPCIVVLLVCFSLLFFVHSFRHTQFWIAIIGTGELGRMDGWLDLGVAMALD